MSSAPDPDLNSKFNMFKRTDIASGEKAGPSTSDEMNEVDAQLDTNSAFDQSMMTQSSNSVDNESVDSNRPFLTNILETRGVAAEIIKNKTYRPPRPRKKSKLKEPGSDEASTLSSRDVTQYFGQVEYFGYKTIAECIPGDTYMEVLQGLIDNMKETGIALSISTAEELLSTLEQDVPDEMNEKIEKVEQHFLAILQKVGSTDREQDFFEKLLNSVHATRLEPEFCPVPVCSFYLEDLCTFTLKQLHPGAGNLKDGQTEMHAKWRNILQSLLQDFCLGYIPRSTSDEWAMITFSMLHHGDKTYTMSIVPEPTPLEKNAADSTTDDTYEKPTLLVKPAKEFRATPGFAVKANIAYLDGENIEVSILNCETKTSNSATLPTYIFTPADSEDVAGTASTSTATSSTKAHLSTRTNTKQTQMKSSRAGSVSAEDILRPSTTGSKRQAPDSVSSTESSKRQRVDPDEGSDFTACGTKLLSQHFMELLGAIRTSGEWVNVYKTFGIFQTMNRIVFTHLSPASTGDPTSTPHLYNYLNFPKMKCSSDYHEANIAEPRMWFRMSICRYLDLFKPNHFRALTAMVQYVVFHEVQEVAKRYRMLKLMLGKIQLPTHVP